MGKNFLIVFDIAILNFSTEYVGGRYGKPNRHFDLYLFSFSLLPPILEGYFTHLCRYCPFFLLPVPYTVASSET